MSIIVLTTGNGVKFKIFAVDADLAELTWTAVKQRNYLYIVRRKRRGRGSPQVGIHRVILGRMYPHQIQDPHYVCDHIDGDPLNNCRDNLRLCTRAQNRHNGGADRNNVSGYRGVTWNAKRQQWHATITAYGQRYFLGWFKDSKEAAKAYDQKAREVFGEFAKPNLPEEPNG